MSVTVNGEGYVTVVGWLSVLVLSLIIGAAAIGLSLVFTNPLGLGPLGVTLWFLVLLVTMAAAICLVLYAVKWFLHVHATGLNRLRYSWRQGLLASGWVTGLLALSSLHQLSTLDGILLALLLGIVEVYVRLRWP